MEGFFIGLDSHRSLAEFGQKLGAVYVCAVYYHPHSSPAGREADQLDVRSPRGETILISAAERVDEDASEGLESQFANGSMKIYLVEFHDRAFLREVASLILDDGHVWIFQNGWVDGHTFVENFERFSC